MSLMSWLSKGRTGGNKTKVTPENGDPLLPNPDLETSAEKREETAAANKTVAEAVAREANSRKRKPYHHNDDELKAKKGRYAAENGNKRAVEKFSKELEHNISDSTVRQFKKAYCGRLKELGDPSKVTSLPRLPSGRPTLLKPAHEDALRQYILKLHDNGGAVQKKILSTVLPWELLNITTRACSENSVGRWILEVTGRNHSCLVAVS